jgi:hypothetical protein
MELEHCDVNPSRVKRSSEEQLRALGARTCDWLPIIDHTTPRDSKDIAARALVLDGLVQIYFRAPIDFIENWISQNGLEPYLSSSEIELLGKNQEHLPERELVNLHWSIEALWALMWIGGLVSDLPLDKPVRDTLASMLPSVKNQENASPFYENFKRRSYGEIYKMLDLYYRAHWYALDGRLNGYDTSPISLDIVVERRKALEWAIDSSSDWDHIDLST